jgi:CheY-like chemotaxis protein
MLRWLRSGIVAGTQTPGGHWRICVEDLAGIAPRENRQRLPSSGESVLVVDEDPTHRAALVHVIRSLYPGLQVESEANGFDAAFSLGARVPHLVFVDLKMPDVSGLELIRRSNARPSLRGVVFVVISACLDAENRCALEQLGVPPLRLLEKPVAPARIVETLAEFLPQPPSLCAP